MDLGALFIGFSVFLLSSVVIANPFLQKTTPNRGRKVKGHESDLKMRRQAALAALRDLEFDHQTGKVAEDDFISLRADLLASAAKLLPKMEPAAGDLEALIQTRREKLGERILCQQCGARLKIGDRYCSVCGASTQWACLSCGHTLAVDDQFCRYCGTSSQRDQLVNLEKKSQQEFGE